LSNDGGSRWGLARPGERYCFRTVGSDLRWKAELRSLSPALTPRVETIEVDSIPTSLGNRVWEDLDADGIQDGDEPGMDSVMVYLYDEANLVVDFTFTDIDGFYGFPDVLYPTSESKRCRQRR